jgi:hypothetical protein
VSDLVQRLRAMGQGIGGPAATGTARLTVEEAADEIERLRWVVETLRRAIDVGDLSGLARREGA